MLCYNIVVAVENLNVASESLGTPGNGQWLRLSGRGRKDHPGPGVKAQLEKAPVKAILGLGVMSGCAPGTCLGSPDTNRNALS